MKKPSKTAAELEASIKVEMEDICDWPTDMAISVQPDGDSRDDIEDRRRLTGLRFQGLFHPEGILLGLGKVMLGQQRSYGFKIVR